MQHAQLMSHVDTDLITREQLALVETPDATRSFKPVPHIRFRPTGAVSAASCSKFRKPFASVVTPCVADTCFRK